MALPKAGVELVADGLASFTGDMGKANSAVAAFGSTGQRAGGMFARGFGEIVTGALRQVGAAAVEFAAQGAKAVGDFLTDAVSQAGDFEQGMLEFQAIAGKGVDTTGLQQFHDLFLQLGKELPVSTSEVQQAAIEMVKGGIDPATVAAGGLRQTIQFAAAAMDGDLAGAAEIAAKAVAGWAEVGATAADKAALLTHATDILTKAANASSVGVHDLALGLYNVQGTAKTTGLSLDETTTALAELAPSFSNANTAGSSFRNFLVRLQPATKPAAAAMQELGLMTLNTNRAMKTLAAAGIDPTRMSMDQMVGALQGLAYSMGLNAKQSAKFVESFMQSKFFDETTGKFVGVAKASQLLQDATKNLTDAERVEKLERIFGNDAMNAAAALAERGAAGYSEMAASLASANGVTANAAIKQQGYNTALENAKGSVEALKITIGEKLLPALTSFLNNVVAPGVNTLTTLADAVTGNKAAFEGLPGPLQTVATGMQAIGAGAQAVGDFVGGLVERAQHAAAGFQSWQAGTVSLKTALDVLSPGLGSLAPLIQGVIGVAEKVYAIFAGQVAPILSDLGATVLPILGSALQVVSGLFTDVLLPATNSLATAYSTLFLPVLAEAARWLRDNVPPAVQVLADFLTGTLFPALHTVYDFLDTNVIPLLAALGNVLSAVVGKAVEGLAALWSNILLPKLQEAGGWIDKTLGPILSDFTAWLSDVTGGVDGITSALQIAIKWLHDLASSIGQLKLPDWLTPGSPTPWEIGLRGIGDALKSEVNPQVKALLGELTLAPPASPSQILAGGGGTTITNNRTLNMPIHTNMSPAAIQMSAAIAQAVLP